MGDFAGLVGDPAGPVEDLTGPFGDSTGPAGDPTGPFESVLNPFNIKMPIKRIKSIPKASDHCFLKIWFKMSGAIIRLSPGPNFTMRSSARSVGE